MSDKVLSQDEVDALLKGVASGDIDTDDAKDKIMSGVTTYDFTSQERVIRGRMPGLEMTNEAFSRMFRTSLGGFFMKFVDISIQNVDVIKFGDFIKTIPMPSSINIFKMEPLKGLSLLVLEAPLVFAFIEFFFGGSSAKYVKSEGRAFTPIEQRVIKKVVDIALKDLEDAWEILTPLKTKYTSSEINPQFVSIVTPQEIVINIEVQVEIEEFTGKLFLCVPYSMIEPIKDKLYSGIHGDKVDLDQKWTMALKESLQSTPIELDAEIGSLQVDFEQLMNFEVGNVISLPKSISDDIVVNVEGIPKYYGKPGISKGNQAVVLTRTIE